MVKQLCVGLHQWAEPSSGLLSTGQQSNHLAEMHVGRASARRFLNNIKGVVFYATPHTAEDVLDWHGGNAALDGVFGADVNLELNFKFLSEEYRWGKLDFRAAVSRDCSNAPAYSWEKGERRWCGG